MRAITTVWRKTEKGNRPYRLERECANIREVEDFSRENAPSLKLGATVDMYEKDVHIGWLRVMPNGKVYRGECTAKKGRGETECSCFLYKGGI